MLWPHNSRSHVPWQPLSLLQCLLKDGIIPRKYTVPFYNYQRPWIGWLHKEISWPSLPHYPCTSQGSLPSVAQLWEWKTLLQGKKKKVQRFHSCGTEVWEQTLVCFSMFGYWCFTKMFVMGALGLKKNFDSVQRGDGGFGTASCYTWTKTRKTFLHTDCFQYYIVNVCQWSMDSVWKCVHCTLILGCLVSIPWYFAHACLT